LLKVFRSEEKSDVTPKRGPEVLAKLSGTRLNGTRGARPCQLQILLIFQLF